MIQSQELPVDMCFPKHQKKTVKVMPCFFHQWNPENEKVPHSATAALDLQMGIDLRVTQLSLQASTCRPQNLHNLPAAP